MQPKAARNSQKQPEVAKSGPQLSKSGQNAKGGRSRQKKPEHVVKWPELAKSSQKLP